MAGLFSGPKIARQTEPAAPAPEPSPAPMPDPDDTRLRAVAHRTAARRSSKSGRQATILSDNQRQTLG